MVISKSLRALFSYGLFFSLCTVLFGQATGSISGTVTDVSGAPISGAKVTVTGQNTGSVRDAISDSSGHYVVRSSA